MSMTLDEAILFVKEQVQVQDKLAQKFADQPYRANLHRETGSKFRSLEDLLLEGRQAFERKLSTLSPIQRENIFLTPDDLPGLPDELVKEFSLSDADKLEFQIMKVLRDAGGILSLDKILLGLYRLTGEVQKRNPMTSRLYRMVQKGTLYSVPGRKGVYSVEPLADAEARRLFGNTFTEYGVSQEDEVV